MKGIIVLGSSRSDGNTYKCVKHLSSLTGYEIIDLNQKNIRPYNYSKPDEEDDFRSCFLKMVNGFEMVVFATPVYWYTMSGILKTFIDRFSDCLTTFKEDGRKLKGMKMGVLSCSNADDRSANFVEPFALSAQYLGMEYLGDIHCYMDGYELHAESKERISRFAESMK